VLYIQASVEDRDVSFDYGGDDTDDKKLAAPQPNFDVDSFGRVCVC